ncbi:MAG: hypothetical protein WA160_17065 [Pseudobdellovibrio sp.]
MFSTHFFILLATLVSLQISNAEINEKSDIFLKCKRDKNIRWLRAFRLENGKCKTYYSKEGYLQVVSSATFFASCEGVLQSVRKNIEEGGFKCQEMSSVQVVEIE